MMSGLIDSLRNPSAYPHAVSPIELLETHISWVLLTGPYAYKIKKPIKLKFLDFSTLERRKHFCQEEIRLNRRWDSGLYLEVVEIRGSVDQPVIGGDGELVDYAVKMRQFPQSALLDAQLHAGNLDEGDMISLAEMLAEQHAASEICRPDSTAGLVDSLQQQMLNNFESIASSCDESNQRFLLQWTQSEFEKQRSVLIGRRKLEFVRECHGDLHLGNLVRLEHGIRAFDCVEFSDELRNIDVISDVAFLVMDLFARHRTDLAFHFLNRYLEISGDYNGLLLLDLYVVYHCMIRAKVAAIRSGEREAAADVSADLETVDRYLGVAKEWLDRSPPCLIIMHGFSGSGKTTLSEQLIGALPAIRTRSDVERKRAHNVTELGDSASGINTGIYSDESSTTIYEKLAEIASLILRSGQSSIVDASFLRAAHRLKFSVLAESLGVTSLIVDAYADVCSLRKRISARKRSGNDVSEADESVLNYQLQMHDPLTKKEMTMAVSVSTDSPIDANTLLSDINDRQQKGNNQLIA